MSLSKILGGVLILLSILFLGLQSQMLVIEASGIRALAMLLLLTLYIFKVEGKNKLFFMFLVTYTIAEIFNYVTWVRNLDLDPNFDYFYFVGNGIYILAYLFLIGRIFSKLNFIKVISKFPFQTILLVILGVSVAYLLSDITKNELNVLEYYTELSYNSVIMFLMCLSLVNYMYKDDKKSINLLVGSICIVFSETLQLAYFYISEEVFINLLCSVFFVVAFLFFYLQSRLISKHENSFEQQQKLNA